MKKIFTRLLTIFIAVIALNNVVNAQSCAWDLAFDGLPTQIPGIPSDPFCADEDYFISVLASGTNNPFGATALSGTFLVNNLTSIDPNAPFTLTGNSGIIFSPDLAGQYTFSFESNLSGACLLTQTVEVTDCGLDCTNNNAGVVGGSQNVCYNNSTSNITAQNFNITSGSSITYVLHSPQDINTNFGTSTTGVFSNTGVYPQNIPLCISAIVAPGPAGVIPPDLNDPCVSVSIGCVQVVFLDEIIFTTSETCDFINDQFMVDVTINGGFPAYFSSASYDVTGDYVNNMALPGVTYTFGPLPSGSTYSVVVANDGAGCNGSYNGIELCENPQGCANVVGFMSPALQTACSGDFINAPVIGSTVDAGNVLTYVLHNGTGTIGTIFGYSTNGVFTNDGSLPTNVQLYVSAVIGPPDANGNASFTNACTVFALPGTPVRFFDPINISHEYVCNNADGTYVVNFIITGGGPGYPNSGHTYNTTGVISGNLQPGITYSSSPILDGSTYSITVLNDGKGCEEAILEGPIQCNKLPVELISFDGVKEIESNLLTWVSAAEVSNAFYTLEVSKDGLNFETVANVEGVGNSTTETYYQYNDENIFNGIAYYRLSQTDYDGNEKEIGFLQLERNDRSLIEITDIYPNPVKDMLTMEVVNVLDEEFEITIMDASGRMIYYKVEEDNSNVINIDASNFASGIYVLKATANNFTSMKKFIKN